MIIPIVSPLITLVLCLPAQVNLQAKDTNPLSLLENGTNTILLAECSDPRPDGGPNGPAGLDPHGPDPHMERIDPDLPANRYQDSTRPPLSPYGNDIPNSRSPY